METIKIVNGCIPDFSKKEFVNKDIYIEDGKIVDVGTVCKEADVVIDAEDRIVSPGFIDIHMHEETLDKKKKDPYYSANCELLMGVTTCVAGNCGNNRQSLSEFIGYVEENGSPVNYMSFIGHNFLRKLVGVDDRYRASSSIEIDRMKRVINCEMTKGIVGISYGIEYSPGISSEEIIGITEGLESGDYLLSAHFREDGEKSVESIKELIQVNKETGLPMQVSHIGSCSAYGFMGESLEMIDSARKEGCDITADCYPYDAFATYLGSAVFDEGCFERWHKGYEDILLTEEPYLNTRCNKELFEKVRKEYPNMIVAAFVMREDEVIEAFKAPYVYVGSDSLFRGGMGHPRGAGSFPRVISRYVRDRKELDIIDALWKMTAGPAGRLKLNTKGNIEVGMDADITIFDLNTMEDMADFEKPTLSPKGIDYVILDGKVVVENNRILYGREGKFIRYRAD
ncbi:N-acyl-D-amino-acid deacylase [Dethiosulfatibacter aminovorans DSM 17477]|uniref:N-acyl-D-amino-acid deacylase n=1 Tax=Dethiosulfatibacter aminovorans DSM 17477 TaxID=1121476 RepID=A0A1M6EZJ9_9FIRM|nr:amidohydrolase family protein [Dethiosulfatibacter aminovorans]SHI90867.1 N-acyl-D-amino-acid deacylase [Dethiosulfatibacter aminovorans DSM 17477]